MTLGSGDDVVCGAADGDGDGATGEENAAGTGGLDGLEVDLLLVDDVSVVEGFVFGVDTVDDGGVEGVRRLLVGHDGDMEIIQWDYE